MNFVKLKGPLVELLTEIHSVIFEIIVFKNTNKDFRELIKPTFLLHKFLVISVLGLSADIIIGIIIIGIIIIIIIIC
jgi:hypothetical protein